MSREQKNFWSSFIGSIVVAGIVLSVVVLPDTIRNWNKQYGDLPFAYGTKRAEEIMTNLLTAWAEQGDTRSAADLLALEKARTPQYQLDRPLLWKTVWSAMFATSLYGRQWPARLEMWTLNRPATITEVRRITEPVGSAIASPTQVEEWVKRSAVHGSVWPLEKRQTFAVLQSVPRVPYIRRNGHWREIQTDAFPLPAGTDILLVRFLPGQPADYGL